MTNTKGGIMAKAPSKPTKKSAAKATSSPKVRAKASAKTAVEKTAKKPASPKKVAAAKKTVATKKSAAQKSAASSKQSLQAKLDSVSKRLNAAKTQTEKNITALEMDFSALAKQMGRAKAGHTRLTRRVTELSKTLTTDLESIQNEIRKDLTETLLNPTLDSLQAALERADERLTESEAVQGMAIARINRHIADIATIVEERLSDEAQARTEAMAEMKRAMDNSHAALEEKQSIQAHATQLRVSNLQSESADAIRSLGDKLVEVAEEMGRRRDTLGTKLRQELNESSISANAEFEQFRRVVERRLEAIEADALGYDSQIDRAIAPLYSRIEGLEYGLTQAPEPSDYAPNLQTLPPISSQAASALSAPVNTPEPSPALHEDQPQIQAAAPSPAPQPPAPLQPAALVPGQASTPPLDLTQPAVPRAVPYDPAAYQAAAYGNAAQPHAHAQPLPAHTADPYASTAYAQNPYGESQYGTEPAYAAAEYVAPQQYGAAQQPPFPQAGDLAVIEDDLPYADPAYAEGDISQLNQSLDFSDDSMGAARPGATSSLKKMGRKARKSKSQGGESSSRTSFITPRNLKLGGLVAALGVASFIGAQTLKGGSAPASNQEFSVASNAALDESRPTLGGMNAPTGQILPPDGAVQRPAMLNADGTAVAMPQVDQETIGQYADNRKMALAEGGETALNTAARAGNPIAQLQLGLSHIEKGELESGVNLIRASANQEQPAALYRLAKLYETGQGVGQDAQTARQLTERAARGGNRIAMHDLALYFAEGRGGIDIDMPTAAKWFEKAAERGVVDSQFNLGVLFESGQGLPQDMESALVWYSIAGTQGDQMAAGRVGVLRKTLSEDQISRADKRIASFTPSRIDEEANGIFNNVPWAKPSQVAARGADKDSIVQTQTLLNELGYAVGTADGAIGPKTKNAIMNFQKNNGMSETGVVNAELIERLSAADGV